MTVETNRTLTAVANGPASSLVLPGVRPAATSGRVTGDRRRLRRTLTADVQIAVVNAAPTVSSITRDHPLRPDRVSLSSSGSDETALCRFRVRRRRGTHAPKQSLNLGRSVSTQPRCAEARHQNAPGRGERARPRDPTTAPRVAAAPTAVVARGPGQEPRREVVKEPARPRPVGSAGVDVPRAQQRAEAGDVEHLGNHRAGGGKDQSCTEDAEPLVGGEENPKRR